MWGRAPGEGGVRVLLSSTRTARLVRGLLGTLAAEAITDFDFTNVPGGFPIEVDGEVIGGVAAGGAKIEQDVEVAKAALAALTL